MWPVDCDEADEKGGRKQKRKFSQKVMIWLGVCSKGAVVSNLKVEFNYSTIQLFNYLTI